MVPRRPLAALALAGALAATPPADRAAAAPALAATTPEAAHDGRRLDVGALPVLAFDTDIGLTLGGSLALFFRHPGYRPYRLAAAIFTMFTTEGLQLHILRVDAPDLLHSGYRALVSLEVQRDKFRPFFGVGNATGAAAPADADGRFFEYDLLRLGAVAAVDRVIARRFRVGGELQLNRLTVDPYPGSLLEEAPPPGAGDGRLGQAQLLLGYDARDVEASPGSGGLVQLSGRVGHPLVGSTFRYQGVTAIATGYWSPLRGSPRLVLAGRVAGDLVAGQPPLLSLETTGGRPSIDGLGGIFSLRGLERYRYVGKVKLLANGEVRSRVGRRWFGPRPLDLWLVGFFDVGRVWAGLDAEGEGAALHHGVGGGLRLAWVEDYVLRLDVGAAEGGRELYLTFGQLF